MRAGVKQIAVSLETPDPGAVAEAVSVLRAGGIVAFPTETVYGLAVDAANEAAVRRLYAAKGRDAAKACAYLLPSREAAERLLPPLEGAAARLADAFWPGPVTLVVPDPAGILVGLRLPSDALPRALAAAFGGALLQTSANRSGQPAALNAAGVRAALGDSVDLVLDGGTTRGRKPSTVVKCDGRSFTILREGAVSAAEIAEAATDLLLVVCTANVCRSPLGEALFRLEAASLLACDEEDVVRHGFRFGSFGVSAVPGRPPTDEAVAVGIEHGVDIASHRSRIFSIGLLRSARRVYCMARAHEEFLEPYFHDRRGDLLPLSPEGKEVDDPYGRSLKAYRRAAEMIHEACRARLEETLAAEETEPG
jgi:tRNA threonylcarbamoyl adenosine modification protein (Sua5/YciO/YrdC/YwlC family)